ncbi:uncharacterized protein LOC134528032 [Bacillus rossius redtenbacheri]|uniref:uncharacterized protein LOC134528032 n=1 Tax=Bacillus rossius redtenbacheri TaxID=93214 RepID=UPI002FDE6F84
MGTVEQVDAGDRNELDEVAEIRAELQEIRLTQVQTNKDMMKKIQDTYAIIIEAMKLQGLFPVEKGQELQDEAHGTEKDNGQKGENDNKKEHAIDDEYESEVEAKDPEGENTQEEEDDTIAHWKKRALDAESKLAAMEEHVACAELGTQMAHLDRQLASARHRLESCDQLPEHPGTADEKFSGGGGSQSPVADEFDESASQTPEDGAEQSAGLMPTRSTESELKKQLARQQHQLNLLSQRNALLERQLQLKAKQLDNCDEKLLAAGYTVEQVIDEMDETE